MGSTFRGSMNWLHTWAGVALGALLFAIFWMGTLSVFDREIDRWMMPATRLAFPAASISLDELRRSEAGPPDGASFWLVQMATERQPTLRVLWRDGAVVVERFLDPVTGAELPDQGSWAGTRFIFPFHYALHLRVWDLGYWLVGIAAMAMLVLCVSGVILHRRIFADFFVLRAHGKSRRFVLDLHTAVGVLGFPFHVMIALSGLVIFFSIFFPGAWQTAYQGDRQAFLRETFGVHARAKAGEAGEAGSLDEMVRRARQRWQGGEPSLVRLWHPGDAASVVEVRRAYEDSVTTRVEILYFDAITGNVLHDFATAPIATAQRFISGLHFVLFRHWTLRWIYFGLGLVGCALIATGYLFWLESRRRRHEQQGLRGLAIVEGLAIGSMMGIIVATVAFFVVNRLLPLGSSFLGQDRSALEIWTFYGVWLASFAHGWWRPGRAWQEQFSLIALLAVAAVLLNWITTGDHLLRSFSHRHLWPIAGMDVLLLLGAATALSTAKRLRKKAS